MFSTTESSKLFGTKCQNNDYSPIRKRNDFNALSKSDNDFDKFIFTSSLKVNVVSRSKYVNMCIVIYSLEGGLKLGIVRD